MSDAGASEFLVFVTLPGTSEQFSARFSSSALVGRAEDADIRLPHPLVSRWHVELSCAGDAVTVRDLGSRNGTIVDDAVINGESLTVGSRAALHVTPYSLVVTAQSDRIAETMAFEPGAPEPVPTRVVAEAAVARERTSNGPSVLDNPDGLTERELEVIAFLPRGYTNQAIADALVISPRTVGNHVANILAKTRLANRAEAAAYAVRLVPFGD
jgi:DNA-binding CsgD family transcriptional regulator